MHRPILASIVVGATLVGCATEPQDEPRVLRPGPATGASQDAIKGGYTDPDDTGAVGIIAFIGNQGLGICSGSLLLPNMVLTARHCVSDTFNDAQGVQCSQTNFSAPYSADSFYVTTKLSFSQNESDYHQVREVVTLPVDNLLCGQDMAILILSDAVTPGEAVPYVPRVDTALAEGEQYYAIGYGDTNDGAGDAGLRRRRDDLFVDCVEAGCAGEFGVLDTEWVGDQGICSGDSGGPALDMLDRVVGVTSRGVAGCDDPVYGAVHSWGQWIKDTAVYAAGLGGTSPPPWATGAPTDPNAEVPIGQACTSGTECPSGLCWAGACTRTCGDTFPCPDGYNCVAEPLAGGQSICEPIPNATTDTSSAASGSGTGAGDDGGSDDDDDGDDGSSKKKSSGDSAEDDGGGCSASGRDPVTPVPWVVGLAFAGAAALRRRRR